MNSKDFEQLAAAIVALFPPLSEREQRLSLALYRLLAKGAPVSNEALANDVAMQAREVERTLATWPALYRDAAANIVGYAGLTVSETKHRMRIAGTSLYAWCAWDTLFLPSLLGASAQVESRCATSDQRISLTVHPDRVEHAAPKPFVSLIAPEREKAWTDIVSHFCCHIQFFADERAALDWAERHPESHIATLEQAWELGRRRNELSYPAGQG